MSSSVRHRSSSEKRQKQTREAVRLQRVTGDSESQFKEIENTGLRRGTHEVAMIDSEKVQLVKRLNMILVEVDKLNSEKSDLLTQLHQERLKVEELERKLRHGGTIKTGFDRSIQNELIIEKEEVSRLRSRVNHLEIERNELLHRCKLSEDSADNATRTQDNLVDNQRRTEEQAIALEQQAHALQQDNQSLGEQVRRLTLELSQFQSERIQILEERDVLRQNLRVVDEERADAIHKASEEAVRSDNLVVSTHSEKENLLWLHSRHSRLISSRSLFLNIEKITNRRLNFAIGSIGKFRRFRDSRYVNTRKLWHILNRYSTSRERTMFRRWASRLDWRGTQHSRIQLATAHSKFVTKTKLFNEWRTMFLKKTNIRSKQDLCLRVMYKLMANTREGMLRAKFSNWSNYTYRRAAGDDRLRKSIIRWTNLDMSAALNKWKQYLVISAAEQAREDLATELAIYQYKNVIFNAFKYTVFRTIATRDNVATKEDFNEKMYQLQNETEMQQQMQHKYTKQQQVARLIRHWRSRDLSGCFNRWLKEVRDFRRLQYWARKFRSDSNTTTIVWAERCLAAWKYFHQSAKINSLSGELNVERPRRQQLEANLHLEMKEHARLRHKGACRAAAKWFGGQLKNAIDKWQEVTYHFRITAPRVKNMILIQFHKRLKHGFSNWRSNTLGDKNDELFHNNTMKQAEIESHLDTIDRLEKDRKNRKRSQHGYKMKRMHRAAYLYHKLHCKTAIRRWATNALTKAVKESAVDRLEAKLRQRMYYLTMKKIMRAGQQNAKKKANQLRLKNQILSTWRGLQSWTMYEWKEYVRSMKLCRKVMQTMVKRTQNYQLSKGFNAWVQNKDALKLGSANDHIDTLQESNEKLEDNLKRTQEELRVMSEHAAKLTGKLSKKSKQRLINAAQRMYNGGLTKGFYTWKDSTKLNFSQGRKMSRMQLLWNKQMGRRAFRTWMRFAAKAYRNETETTITNHVMDKKMMRRETANVKSGLEQEVAMRDDLINTNYNQMQELTKRLNFMMVKNTATTNSQFSENKAYYCFKLWAARYRKMKASLARIMNITTRSTYKSCIYRIKDTAQSNKCYNSVKTQLVNAFKNYQRRELGNLFITWNRNAIKTTKIIQLETISARDEQIQDLNTLHQNIKHNTSNRAVFVLEKQTKQKVFNGWVSVNLQLRRINNAKIQAAALIGKLKQKSGLAMMNQERSRIQTKNLKNKVAEENYLKSVTRSAFNDWIFSYKRTVFSQEVFKKVQREYYLQSVFYSFFALKTKYVSESVSDSHVKSTRGKNFEKALGRLPILILRKRFSKLRSQTADRNYSKSIYKAAICNALHGKLRAAWKLWQEGQLIGDYLRDAETAGPVAVENNLLKDRVAILSDLIATEGIDPHYVENYILEKESLKGAQRRMAVSRLQYNAKNSVTTVDTSNVLPRAFLTWKMWFIKKKRIMRNAKKIWARIRRPGMCKAFNVWKRGLPLVVNTLSSLTRQELFGLVAKMDRDIKNLESLAEQKHVKIKYLQNYSTILEDHTRRGQNQAMALCSVVTHENLRSAMRKWQVFMFQSRLIELGCAYSGIEDDYYVAKTEISQLAGDNRFLSEENAELRQASLDGIAIADAIEELSKEREKLSVDLADRAATIKNLLEENSELSYKLSSAQREAERLAILTRTPPERDVPAHYEYTR